ncbi:MAG: hypothetical protein IKJ55_05780, partial [Clostridia bacterium]|nr:hypothetical protein [Clostridia bacterium]
DNQTENALISYGNMAFTDVGVMGKALNLKDGYLALKNSDSLILKDSFTFAAWVNFNEMTSGCPMFISRTASSGDPFNGPLSVALTEDYFSFKTDITFQMKDGTFQSHSFYSGPVIEPRAMIHNWHHIAVVFDKTILYYYLDGELVGHSQLPESFGEYQSIANNSEAFCIGRGIGTNINAVIDEIHFSNRVLPYEEIIAHKSDAVPFERNEIVLTEGYNTIWVNGVCHYAPANIVKDPETDALLIPAKAVMEHMGAKINWDNTDRMGRLDITYKNTTISVWQMDSYANVNGNRLLSLGTTPVTYNGAAFIPASLLRDGFGIQTEWNSTLKQLTIIY